MTEPHQKPMRMRARERGLALLVVLWIIVAAALVVSAFSATVRSGVAFVGSEVELSKTEALLDAGLEVAVAHLIDEEEARRWISDGRPYRISFAGADLAISIRDSSAYIDINKAEKELLDGLLRRYAGSEASAVRLRDRILAARGTQPKRTERETNADGARGADDSGDVPVFVDVAQLRGLEGMTPELYAAIAPFLTVYSTDGRINPRSAPDEVLASVPGLTQGDVEKLRAAAGRPGNDDMDVSAISDRAGGFLTKDAGPAYLVTVDVLRPDGGAGTSAVYVIALGLDGAAPYRLIARRPSGTG